MAERFKHVYCFEPSPENYACLVKNLEEHQNVTTSPIALGQRVGTCKISRCDRRAQNSGSEYIIRTKDGDTAIQPLDALQVSGCDFLKLDVEGGEYHVLLGGQETIGKHRPVVIMECDKKFARRRFDVSDDAARAFLVNVLRYREVAHIRPDRIFVPI
jgi:FkbM family methyltransferase